MKERNMITQARNSGVMSNFTDIKTLQDACIAFRL